MKVKTLIKFAKGRIKSILSNRRIPLIVKLTLLSKCNLRCTYCNSPLRSPKSYSTMEVIEIIDNLSKLGTARITFTGGEPLLRNDLETILRFSKMKGIYNSLITNGVLFPQKYKKIIEFIDQLIVSFDGPKQIHEFNRGKNTFKYLMDTFKISKENNINLWTITVLTKRNTNKRTIDFILRKARKYNFKATFQVVTENETLGRNYESLLADSNSYRKIFSYILKKKNKGYPVGSSSFYLEKMVKWKDFKVEKVYIPGKKCYAGRLFFNIDIDRKIYPCSLLVGTENGIKFTPNSILSSLRKIKNPKCNLCRMSCYIEYNAAFSFNFSEILNYSKNFIKI